VGNFERQLLRKLPSISLKNPNKRLQPFPGLLRFSFRSRQPRGNKRDFPIVYFVTRFLSDDRVTGFD
jgi:hypothetical protein